MKSKELSKNIENLRNKLNHLIGVYGEKSDIVLECSQELDKLIFISYRPHKPKEKKSVSDALIGIVCQTLILYSFIL